MQRRQQERGCPQAPAVRPRGRGESSRSAGAARGVVPEGAASDTSAAPGLWSPGMRSWGEITVQALPWGQDFTPRRGALLKQQEAPCKRERKSLEWGATMGAQGGGSQLGAPMGAGDGHRPRHHVPTNGPPSLGAGCCKQVPTPCPPCPLLAVHLRGSGMLAPITAMAPCHPWDHTLPGAFQTRHSSGHVPEAAALTAPKSKIPSLWPSGQWEQLCPHIEQK